MFCSGLICFCSLHMTRKKLIDFPIINIFLKNKGKFNIKIFYFQLRKVFLFNLLLKLVFRLQMLVFAMLSAYTSHSISCHLDRYYRMRQKTLF
jgi:hypothetical protein